MAKAVLLLVEDEEALREELQDALSFAGFDMVVACDGAEALGLINSHEKPFGAIITDIGLGDGPDGWDVAQRARELDSSMPVIYMSGARIDEWRERGVANGVTFTKPFRMVQMLSALSMLTNRGGAPQAPV